MLMIENVKPSMSKRLLSILIDVVIYFILMFVFSNFVFGPVITNSEDYKNNYSIYEERLLSSNLIAKDPNENVVFLRRLATAEDSPFHALSSYMRSLNLPLNSDEDILRAFNFIGGIKLPKEYDNQLNDMINFLLGLNSESPVPLTILDCINAEAWLRAGKNCLYP